MDNRLRRQLIVISMLVFFLGFEAGGFQLVVLYMANEFKLSSAEMGNIISIQFLAMVVMPLIFGRLADDYGKKPISILSCMLLIIGSLVASLAGNAIIFAAAVFIIGTGYSVCEGISMAAVSDACPEKSAGYLNIVQAFFSIGAIISPIAVDFAITNFKADWRIVFNVIGVAYSFLIIILFRTEYLVKVFESTETDTKLTPVRDKFSYLSIMNLSMIGLFGAMFIYVGLENGIGYYLNSFMTEVSVPKLAAYCISLFWLSMVISRLIFGFINFRIQIVIPACFMIAAGLLLILSGSAHIIIQFLTCSLIGFVFGPIWPSLISLATKSNPKYSATISSIMYVSGGLGGTVFASFAGWVKEYFSIRVTFSIFGILSLIGCLIFLICISTSKKATTINI